MVVTVGLAAAVGLGRHMPAWQVLPPVHLVPQVPQFLGSAAVLTQVEPQRVGVAAQGMEAGGRVDVLRAQK